MADFHEILKNVPDWQYYYTVDQLKQSTHRLVNEYPDKVELIPLGESANGERIDCLKIGKGRHHALIHGFPNPEEPYGGNVLDYFSEALVKDDRLRETLDYTWYLIKCSDPDGARLNEGFQKGPITPLNFAMNFYRTPNNLTAETCFPYRFGPLDLNRPVPETRALMKLMDHIPFDFISSLHMMKFGSLTYQVPYPCPELYPPLQQVARDFDISLRKRLGTIYAPGIRRADYFTPARNFLSESLKGNTNIERIPGCYIYEYGCMMNPDLFMMVPECCIWYDPRLLDDNPSEKTGQEVITYCGKRTQEARQFILDLWSRTEPFLLSPSPFKTMMEDVVESMRNPRTIVGNPETPVNEEARARRATVAAQIGMEGRADFYRMFHMGTTLRAIQYQIAQGAEGVLETARMELEDKIKECDLYFNNKYRVITRPIRNLVGMAIGSILHSAEYVKSRRSWYA